MNILNIFKYLPRDVIKVTSKWRGTKVVHAPILSRTKIQIWFQSNTWSNLVDRCANIRDFSIISIKILGVTCYYNFTCHVTRLTTRHVILLSDTPLILVLKNKFSYFTRTYVLMLIIFIVYQLYLCYIKIYTLFCPDKFFPFNFSLI